jgi:putative transposase
LNTPPEQHNRRSIRLQGYDYTLPGAYFVTIVVKNHVSLFGEIVAAEMVTNDLGNAVCAAWLRLAAIFPIRQDAWVLMPNHLHGIIVLNEIGKQGEASATSEDLPFDHSLAAASPLQFQPGRPRGTRPGSLGAIIQNFKSTSARKIHNLPGAPKGIFWQHNYYERIIRNEREWSAIRKYIKENPRNWQEDSENPNHRIKL